MYNNEKSIDRDVLAGYNAGIERGRLHTGIGLIELARTARRRLRSGEPHGHGSDR